ncbi:hypothetical protein AJ79_02788 [Helicocarpus griseus UAMH5409]|uniref:Uncharacterized protein n=1 Tax=Helicocarpus griseus UAMH5409 TaxID=1447875 RepID=A0A2B7Y153_9EURO|nr:hypothetical protein AJ79_02788 [Helicocarpus griseus UAMH5409]
MVAEYYTLPLQKDTLLAIERFHSRTRRLSGLLHQIHQSSKTWSTKESSGYRDIIIRAAEELLREEVQNRPREPNEQSMHQHGHVSPSSSLINGPQIFSPQEIKPSETIAKTSPQDARLSAHAAAQDLLRERDLTPVLVQDVSRLQNTAFALLTELARASGLRRSE